MCRAAEIGVKLQLTPADIPERIRALVRKFELPDRIPCTMEDYQDAIGLDKKGVGSQIHVILLKELGQAVAVPMKKSELLAQIAEVERKCL